MYHNLFIHSHVGGYFWMDVFWYLCAWVSLGYGFKSGDAESWPMHTSRVKPHCQRWKSQFICLLTIYESSLCSTSSLASKIRLKFSSIGWMKICIAMWFTFLFLWLLMSVSIFPWAYWPLRFHPLSSVWYIFCLFFHHFLGLFLVYL